MTNQEFSNEFDTLYNNVRSNNAPGIDEYEKSVFLTRAQEEIVKNYFNPRSNAKQQGYDDSEKRQVDFSEITKVTDITNDNPAGGTYETIDTRSQLFLMPEDVFMVINEQIKLNEGGSTVPVTVVPISYRQYDMLMSKVYKEPLPRQCWRLIQGNLTSPVAGPQRIVSEIISKTGTSVTDYKIRYVKRPQPIVLVDLSVSGISVNGVDAITECELNPIIHREILDRAVELATVAYKTGGDLQSIVELNKRNE